jgi:Kef-type K+ transport system membrane component KefB
MCLAAAHTEMAPILLGLTLLLVAAKVGGEVATRLGQPSVVGEILAGVVLGNVSHVGLDLSPLFEQAAFVILAELGILLLLFEVGVEATVPQMLKTGVRAVWVAVVGVVVPLALGTGASSLFFGESSWLSHVFVGAILCATSVGITARVLRDMGATRTPEARLILGAAVLDDILGLILLATISGLVTAADTGVALGPGRVVWIAGKALLFLAVAIPAGSWLAPRLFKFATRLRGDGVLLGFGLAFCFSFSWLSSLAGLAPIVGAFTAGLILEDAHLEVLSKREARSLEQLLQPLTSFLLPVFFVLIGLKVDLTSFADPSVLTFAAVLTLAAIAGKVACALVVRGELDGFAVGLGMVPRGEVGFIFAGIGTTLALGGRPVVTSVVFAAVVLTVVLTTLAAPPLLARRLRHVMGRRARKETRPTEVTRALRP